MSLISPKNFAAPFASTVNLVTIVVLALLFGIYRLSGGGVFTTDRTTRASQSTPHLMSQSGQFDAPAPNQAQRNPVQAQPQRQVSQDPFADLLRPSPVKKAPAEPGSDDLHDIEKQLGLRK